MLFCDAHNHLQSPRLDTIRSDVLRDAARLGICGAVVNGTKESDWPAVSALADANAWIIPAYGVHPWEVESVSPDWADALVRHLDRPGATMGEIGLDRWKTTENFDRQLEIFSRQWEIACAKNLPVSVHCLRAWGALAEHIRKHPHPGPGFLLHAYGGPPEMVREWERAGAYFSFSASFLAPGRERKLEAFRDIAADRLLVETDAPAMAPPGERIPGRDVESDEEGAPIHDPRWLSIAYDGLADLRGIPIESLASRVYANFQRLFSRSDDHGRSDAPTR